jgi:hypothetical protein
MNDKSSKEVAVTDGANFAVCTVDPAVLTEVITENVGPDLNIFDLDKLIIPSSGGTFWAISTLQGDKMVDHIDGILIYFQDVRGYWATSFEDNPGQPPACSSTDCRQGEGTPGGDCLKCPLAEFGSANKGEGQACTQSRRLFLLTEGSLLPVMIVCPPTSLKNARKYFIKLAGFNVPYHGVITRLKLSKDKNTGGVEFSKVEFETISPIKEAPHAKIQSYRDMINGALGAIPIDSSDFEDVSEKDVDRS